ncbi:hypothetical protein [uncultured Polaribacter sp.]|uniref:hypothetical protein n=1 Tax=uncultured Polaribacter sp. TaxID=174711 RepID=UPI0026227EF2|nr:hypothetical protein [uncultured Polaribacter sp.]
MKRKIVLTIILFCGLLMHSQKEKSTHLGLTTIEELKMNVYEKDTTANAVVLYEHANLYIDKENDYNTRIDYYYRIKILDKTAFNLANIVVNLYKKKRAVDFRGITYNLKEGNFIQKTSLLQKNIFTTKENEKWTSTKFTLPNIKEGSVIEYTYSVINPYLGIPDWEFQSDIPKIKSEFNAAVLGNYKYKIRIVGFQKLDKNNPTIKKDCVYIDGLGYGDCAIFSYGMNNIPAFKEENYMLSKKNYMSRLVFDLESYHSPTGEIIKYTTTWKEADKKLKKLFLNNQTTKKNYFKRRIPESILSIKNNLEKAKKVYSFIQNHYTWNNEYWNSDDEQVKDAYNNKTGSASEINLSLYNSLRAAKIEASLIILSTRNNGIPTDLYPVINDFNYVIVKALINNKPYYLDATNKYFPFGEVPERCLNGRAREINFKEKNDWIILKPKTKATKTSSVKLELTENGELIGDLTVRSNGFFAYKIREKLNNLSEDAYIETINDNNSFFEIDDYKVFDKEETDKPLKEVYTVTIPSNKNLSDKIRLNPFFFERIDENPFKLDERLYPVDFGYARKNNYLLKLQIPDNYKVTLLPKDVAFSLPNKGGSFIMKTEKKENVISMHVRMSINKRKYTSEEYYNLKEFYNQIVITENSYIILEKK